MERLQAGCYYHIYNHANGNEDIFREEKNYPFFLEKYNKYIIPVADTLAYCLMPNHFHLLVKMKDQISDDKTSSNVKTSDVSTIGDTSKVEDVSVGYNYSNHFKNLFQSYTKSVNKEYCRKGSLFNQRFKRKRIASDDFLRTVMIYIHLNPVVHGFCSTPGQWKYSSYNAYFRTTGNTRVDVSSGISYFGDKANLLHCHKEKIEEKHMEALKEFE